MNYKIERSKGFNKSLKNMRHKKKEILLIAETITLLAQNGVEAIPEKMKPHKLIAQYKGAWECHVLYDLLIV